MNRMALMLALTAIAAPLYAHQSMDPDGVSHALLHVLDGSLLIASGVIGGVEVAAGIARRAFTTNRSKASRLVTSVHRIPSSLSTHRHRARGRSG